MEIKTISKETLERVKLLPRIDYVAYQLLITGNQIKPFVKFKKPRTIFFDSADGYFYYLNPFHNHLQKCGEFNNTTI